MSRFIPVNQAQADALEEKLSHKIFRSVADFIEFYNSGLISKKHDEVREITKEITDTYQDVREKNGKLIFINEEELIVDQILADLQIWQRLTKVKREIQSLIESNELKDSDALILTSNGCLHTASKEAQNDGSTKIILEAVGSEKAFTKESDIKKVALLLDVNAVFDDQSKGFIVNAGKVSSLDDGFLREVKNLIPHN